jgi:hypothetical protein
MNRYVYRTVNTDIAELAKPTFVEELNRLGAEGWKLVSTVSHERHGYSHEVHLVLMQEHSGEAPHAWNPSVVGGQPLPEPPPIVANNK